MNTSTGLNVDTLTEDQIEVILCFGKREKQGFGLRKSEFTFEYLGCKVSTDMLKWLLEHNIIENLEPDIIDGFYAMKSEGRRIHNEILKSQML